MLINVIKKYKKAYTLYELIIYMMLVGLILYPMAPMLNYSVQQLKIEKEKYDPNFYNFIEDIKYDNIISSSIICNNNPNCSGNNTEIKFHRIDSCVISYKYNATKKELKRSVDSKGSNCEEGLREYELVKIDDTFNISKGTYINSTTENKIISIEIKNEKYNYKIKYNLFNKN